MCKAELVGNAVILSDDQIESTILIPGVWSSRD